MSDPSIDDTQSIADSAARNVRTDLFTRIMAFLLGFMFIAVGLLLVSIYFEVFGPREVPGGQEPQDIGKFGIYFIAMGLAICLALFFGERFGAKWGWVSFGGSLAALFITMFFTWPYLFPDEKASIGKITFNIVCDVDPGSPDTSLFLATLDVPDGMEDKIHEDIEALWDDERIREKRFVDRKDHNLNHIHFFNGRHILKSRTTDTGELTVPGSVKNFSVMRAVGLIDPLEQELRGVGETFGIKHLFDISLQPDDATPDKININVAVDLSRNHLIGEQNNKLACDLLQ